MSAIREDERAISAITMGQDQQHGYVVGQYGITEITHYDEAGQGAHVAWFKAWSGDILVARVNSIHVCEVIYEQD